MNTTESRDKILGFINAARRKRLALHACYSSLNAALVVFAALLIRVVVRKFLFFNIPYENFAFPALFLSTALMLFFTRYRRLADMIASAIYIDNRFALKDRFSSYLECVQKGIPVDILSFQEAALVNDIIPALRGKGIVDIKMHFSVKYLFAAAVLVSLLSYIHDKQREITLLSKEEARLLSEQEENLSRFIAYLKREDIANVVTEKELEELTRVVKDVTKKIQQSDISRKKAIKLFSKLIDHSKNVKKEKFDMSATQLLSEFDSKKLTDDSEFKDFFQTKQEELAEKIANLKKKELKDKIKEAKKIKDTLASISRKLDEMALKPGADDAKAAGEGQQTDAMTSDISSTEFAKLKGKVSDAVDEMSRNEKIMKLNVKLKDMTNRLQKSKDGLIASNRSAPKGIGGGAAADTFEKLVTFDSRIKKMKQGIAGTDKGPGTTNKDLGYASFDTARPQGGKEVFDMTEAKFEKIYAPSRIKTDKDVLVVKGVLGEGEASKVSTTRALAKTGIVNIPYNQVYGEYRDIAQKAINVQKVPRVYKDYVLDYFDSINPDLK